MYKNSTPIFLICETPLHAGSGDDLGIVDLPIQRERHTSFPKIEASSFKGAVRQSFEKNINSSSFKNWDDDDVKVHRVFGFDDGGLYKNQKENLQNVFTNKTINNETISIKDFSGSIAFTDARLLLFPVKSMKGVFVWITCSQVLNRLLLDLDISENKSFKELEKLKGLMVNDGEAIVSNAQSVAFGKSIILEEYAFKAIENSQVKNLATELANIIFKDTDLTYWNNTLKTNLVVLSNDDFRDFVNQSTEVITRIKIDNLSGTVEDGALFTEEYLPTDSVMYSLVMFSDENNKKDGNKMKVDDVQKFFCDKLEAIKMFQLGGNATLGKGLLRVTLLN